MKAKVVAVQWFSVRSSVCSGTSNETRAACESRYRQVAFIIELGHRRIRIFTFAVSKLPGTKQTGQNKKRGTSR